MTFATAVTTLFWTIAAHTFWKDIGTADLALTETEVSRSGTPKAEER